MGFAQEMEEITTDIRERLNQAVRKVALEMFTQVILASPVDTGRFRGNWQVEIGIIPQGVLEINDKSGTATISAATAKANNLKAGQTIFLVNNLPYARALEFGHSQQAPNGMVRLAVQRFRPILNKVVRELNK